MPKLLIISRDANEYWELVEDANLPDLELRATSNLEEAASIGMDCEIVFGEPTRVREIFPALKNLRWVQATWAGVEPLLDPSLRRDYILTNARGIFGGLMSEYVFGYLLFHERRILERYRAQKERTWDESLTGTLHGKTIGLLGVGSIGAHLAKTAKHFGMSVRGYTRASQGCPDVDTYYHAAELLEFANGLDYLVSVLPSTAETQHVVDAALLNSLPSHAIFINVGRGSSVNETELINALESGQIAGAVLDVFEEEPLPETHPFWETPNLWMTFHTSAPSFPTYIAKVFIENYHRFINGQALKYQVDFELGY